MKKSLLISVHQLVDFLLRTGDIDNRVFNKSTMSEGTRIHSYYQSKQGKDYLSEYLLRDTFEVEDFSITLEGRADGIIVGNEKVIIDEIKSTVSPLDEFYKEQKAWHLGQAKCYALMFAREKGLDAIDIQLTYINQLDKSQMVKTFSYFTTELEKDVMSLLREYVGFYKIIYNRTEQRNKSAIDLPFPYQNFRDGQKDLAKYAYGIAQKGGILFAEAPTGIGKTISTLYPFVKSFANEENEKIFYLTAKNSGKEMAFDAVKLMVEKGLIASAINIKAKDKVCFCPGKACNPDECPFAKGYYTKIRQVLTKAIQEVNLFSTKEIIDIARYNAICPFELSLDISLFVDIIICDYNYFFDPMVYLKRYFDGDASHYLVLVDEAHNLVERGRSMYSASFDSYKFKQVKRSLRGFDHRKIKNAMKRISKIFNKYEDLHDGDTKIDMLSSTDINGINAYLLAATDVNKHHHSVVSDEFQEFFFDLNKFFKLLEFYDSSFTLYVHKWGKDVRICLYNLDPREHLKRTLDMVKSKVIFSATLSPSNYYIDMIGGDKLDPVLFLPSPFEKDNLCLMVAPKISVRYKNRQDTFKEVRDYIHELVNGKVGNYFIYCPSYEYLESMIPYLDGDYDLNIQDRDMNEEEKEAYLSCFVDNPERTTLGLCVIGGAFSEGIDLVGERIIGVVVIGVGLPQICYERDVIKEYFDKKDGLGYNYAYVAPGMNKVMQAVGRVIRSESDKGVALLIDDRYLTDDYHDMFKNSWSHYEVVTSKEDIKETIDNFWKKN